MVNDGWRRSIVFRLVDMTKARISSPDCGDFLVNGNLSGLLPAMNAGFSNGAGTVQQKQYESTRQKPW
jgi:hypothetical protein